MASMRLMKLCGTLALTLLVGAGACDRSGASDASDAPGGTDATDAAEGSTAPQEMGPETMAQVLEIQEIQQKLEPIQQQALQDPALAAQLASLESRIEAAMRAEDAEVVGRAEKLQADMAAAEEAGDQARMQSLMMAGQGLQQEMQVVQARVFERPEIRQAVDDFEAAHRARMIEIDPAAGPLLDRFDEIVASFR